MIRDSRGNWVVGFATKFTTLNATNAESLAIYHGLKLASIMNLSDLEIATDSEEVI